MGYITVALLEGYTGLVYDAVDVGYTDIFVLAQIAIAEKAIKSMCVNPPAAATDGIYAATMILSERFMRNVMITDGYADEMPQSIKAFFDYLITVLLAKQQGMVDSIPFGRGK